MFLMGWKQKLTFQDAGGKVGCGRVVPERRPGKNESSQAQANPPTDGAKTLGVGL